MEKLHQKDKEDKILHHGKENKSIKRIKKVHITTKTWHKHHFYSTFTAPTTGCCCASKTFLNKASDSNPVIGLWMDDGKVDAGNLLGSSSFVRYAYVVFYIFERFVQQGATVRHKLHKNLNN